MATDQAVASDEAITRDFLHPAREGSLMIDRPGKFGQDAEILHDSSYPTKDEQFYRIGGTTCGAAIFGGALASYAGLAVIAGAVTGGVIGLAISAVAASHVHSRKA